MEGKRRSQAKRDCQIALLGDINKTLGLFTRKWTMFAAAVAEKKKHPARSETDVEEMRRALEALWSRLESKVHRCCVKLEGEPVLFAEHKADSERDQVRDLFWTSLAQQERGILGPPAWILSSPAFPLSSRQAENSDRIGFRAS
jgi:hypothetical protein